MLFGELFQYVLLEVVVKRREGKLIDAANRMAT